MNKQTQKFLKTTLDLLQFNTYENKEYIIYSYLIFILKNLGFKVNQDEVGNIYATRGKSKEYPLLNAHMDIVYDVSTDIEKRCEITSEELYGKDEEELILCYNCENYNDCVEEYVKTFKVSYIEAERIFINKNLLKCESFSYDEYANIYNDLKYYDNSKSLIKYTIKNYDYKKNDEILKKEFQITFDEKTWRIESNKKRILGGDDKCGISIALQVAKENPEMPLKILFTVGEESGCVGIQHFCKTRKDWFNNVKYSLTIDRRYGDNLITYACGDWNCSFEFASQITSIGILSGIMVKNEIGATADTVHIRKHVKECVNMSAGYYNPHTLSEYVSFSDMISIKNWVTNILTDI